MGPPLSPRETRRSGRRSAPSVSASTSKSPDSDQPRQKDNSSRVPSSSGGRNKRLKQEDYEEPPEDRRNYPASSGASSVSNSTSKAKRRAKDKDKEKDKQEPNTNSGDQDVLSIENQPQDPQEEEEQGITRCVCGSAGTLYVLLPHRKLTCSSMTQRMIRMRANSWFNAKRAKSGNMGCAWAISPRTKFTTMIIIVSNVGQNYTMSFSSGTI